MEREPERAAKLARFMAQAAAAAEASEAAQAAEAAQTANATDTAGGNGTGASGGDEGSGSAGAGAIAGDGDETARLVAIGEQDDIYAEVGDEYEVTATDHINAKLLSSFKSFLETGNQPAAMTVACEKGKDEGSADDSWDDDDDDF